MSTCGCTWNGPGDGCGSGYMCFKHAWELHLCLVGAGFLDLDKEAQEQLWDEFERWVGRYAVHIGEPVPAGEVQ